MNPTVDNDLQKAIDDITKNTNTDPVFSDPVAAPSSIPEGDTGVIAEPVGPFSDIKPPVMSTPTNMPPLPKAPAPAPTMSVPIATPAPAPDLNASAPAPEPMPEPIAEPIAEPVVETVATEEVVTESTSIADQDMRSVKEAALRDLAPLLNRIDMDSSKKFKLYKDIREELHDDSVISDAYTAAKDIVDEHERGEALLYLIESIDNM